MKGVPFLTPFMCDITALCVDLRVAHACTETRCACHGNDTVLLRGRRTLTHTHTQDEHKEPKTAKYKVKRQQSV